ncbi:HlyD family type I secretion periplasmic adaptor subunit [Pseudoduganella sp.]|uniref:HlyD family type I secretion periplasmic adaptor subunit n=1 Tax=Pseudoduganella sp. TaxID=1880898 RepID=UPI0035B4C531
MNLTTKPQQPPAEVIAHDVTPLTVNTDAGAYAKVGWTIVLIGVVGFLLWATFAPLDKGVPMSGYVAKESNRKAVQHLSGGIVKDILVRDGDQVKAGQVLVRMNDVMASSELGISEVQYFTARAAEARLTAELKGANSIAFPSELEPYRKDPRLQEQVALQSQLFTSRKMAIESEVAAIQENIRGLEAQIQGLEESRDSKKAQQGFLKEQLDNSRDLAKEGYIPRARLLELERTYAQLGGAISEDIGNIARSRRQIAELKLRITLRQQEYQREVRTQLADMQREAAALESRIRAQSLQVANTEVKSPVDGVVVGSTVFTRGGVVAPGAHLMEVVPSEDALIVEGQLPTHLVDKVHPGLKVELIFSAFNTNKTPHVPGEVVTVAADRVVDEKTGMPYYKVRARVTPEGSKMIASHKLDVKSGMPVELFVKTGERTMMSYLLKPLIDRAHSSMSEE